MPATRSSRRQCFWRRAAAALFAALLLLTAGIGAYAADSPVLVTVNDTDITQADVDRVIEEALGVPLAELDSTQRTTLRRAVGRQVETRLVLEVLLEKEAEARALSLDALLEEVVTDAEDEAGKQMAAQAFVEDLVSKADIVRHEVEVEEASPSAETSADVAWHTDYDAAVKESLATGRPILANFTGSDWCPYCVKLSREVFQTDAFQAWASENVVLLELDFPRRPLPDAQKAHNEKIRDRYGVRGFPTVLFLDAEGDVIGRSGYAPGGPKSWIASASEVLRP